MKNLRPVACACALTALALLSSCTAPGSPTPGATTGGIAGRAVYANGTSSAGYLISVEKLQAAETATVRASLAAHAVVPRQVTLSTTTAADGTYALSDLDQGSYTLYASSATSTEKAVETNVEVAAGKTVTAADLALTETGGISGTVLVSASETDNAGTMVFAAGTSYIGMTDAAGSFSIAGIPVGTTCSLMIVHDTYTHAAVTVTVQDSSVKDIGRIDATLDYPWSSGHGAPSASIGAPGNLYVNVGEGTIFRKAGTAWQPVTLLSGSMGTPVSWLGVCPRRPVDPPLNGTYYDSSIGIVYAWDGGAWRVVWKDAPPATILLHRELLASTYADFNLVGLGWDWGDSGLVQYAPDNGPGVAAPQFGSSSYFSNVQGSLNGHDGPRYYTALRIRPQTVLGLDHVTLGQLASISYYTRQQNAAKPGAWQLKIYTEPPSGGTAWYGHRLNAVTPSYADIAWHLNTTDSMSFEQVLAGESTTGDSSLVGKSLSYIQGIPSYTSEPILWIDIIAGFATAGPEVESYLDGVTIRLGSGASIVLDLGD